MARARVNGVISGKQSEKPDVHALRGLKQVGASGCVRMRPGAAELGEG